MGVYEVFGLQHAQCFAHGRPAHAIPLCDMHLIENFARGQVAVQNVLSDPAIDVVKVTARRKRPLFRLGVVSDFGWNSARQPLFDF
jgi:hypothetical protein